MSKQDEQLIEDLQTLVAWVNSHNSRQIILSANCAGLRLTAEHNHSMVTFATEPTARAFSSVAERLKDEDGTLARTLLRHRIGNLEVKVSAEQYSVDEKQGELNQLKTELDDLFLARARVLLSPAVTEVYEIGDVRRTRDRRRTSSVMQSGDVLELSVKTQRMPADSMDCDALGTAYPPDIANEAMETLAKEFGRKCTGFQPIEKGWGYYEFLPWNEH